MPIETVVSESPVCDFYRTTVWKNSPLETPRKRLSLLTRTTYAQTPFLKRLYRTHGLLTKVAYHDDVPFLIGRHLEDIASEQFGSLGARPLVALSNMHECLEKSLWCYSQNVLPLIADANDDIAAMLASRYEADTLITDTAKLVTVLPALASHYKLAPFRRVSVIDTTFNLPLLKKMFPEAELSLVLALPETGSIALACSDALKENSIVFHSASHRQIEHGTDLIVTDDRLLPTPLIRYCTGIPIHFLDSPCVCGLGESFELEKSA